MKAYCVKCRAQREMNDIQDTLIEDKNGIKRKAKKGICPKCGTSMFHMLSPEEQIPVSRRIFNKIAELILSLIYLIGIIVGFIVFLYGLRALVHFLIY